MQLAQPKSAAEIAACKGVLSHILMVLTAVDTVSDMLKLARRKVYPKPMDVWPAWMRDVWLGPVGREHGEAGLRRMAARKYSRQLNCALSLASQVSC